MYPTELQNIYSFNIKYVLQLFHLIPGQLLCLSASVSLLSAALGLP